MSKDARQKLRDMGGIMASSPDLIQAVQKFDNGGPIMPMPPMPPSGPNFAPRMPPAAMSGIRPTKPFFIASDRPYPAAKTPRATRLGGRTFLLTDDNRVIDAETNAPAPPRLAEEVRRKLGVSDVVPGYREAGPLTYGGGAAPSPEPPVGSDDVTIADLLDASLARGVPRENNTLGRTLAEPPEVGSAPSMPGSLRRPVLTDDYYFRNDPGPRRPQTSSISGSLPSVERGVTPVVVSRQNELRAARGLPPLSPEQEMEFTKSAAAAPLAQDISRASEIDAELAAIEDRKVGGAYASSADAAKEESLQTERRQLGESAGKTLAAEDTVMAQPLVPQELSQEQIDKAMELVKESPDLSFLNLEDEDTTPAPDGDTTPAPDGDTTPSPDGDVTPPPGGSDDKPTKRDLRSRYNDQLALMQEIYGIEDKDEAQERAMSLAMIGLAIAAGQSPNALTNIAQGAMVGLNAMGERRDAARERERGLKTLALQTAIDQQAAEAEAEAEAAKMDLEQRNRLELEEYKARLGAMYGGAGGSRDARNIIDFTQNTYTEALKAASAMTAPDFDPDTETPHQYAMRQARQAAESIGKMFPGYGGLTSLDAPAAPEIPTITTREEYDALPSGTKFMQNGQERVKP